MMLTTRKIVFLASLFFAFFAFGFLGINLWLDHIIDDEYEKTFREMYHGAEEYDLIFLGSSHTAHGIHSRYIEEGTGWTVYNFGFDGANSPVILSIYRFILKPRKKRIGVAGLDTIWFFLDEDWMPRTFYFNAEFISWKTLLQYYFSDEVRPPGYAPEQIRSEFRNILEFKVPLLKYQRRLPEIFLRRDFFGMFDSTEVVDKAKYFRGYIPFKGGWNARPHGLQYYRGDISLRPAHVNREWVEVLENTIQQLQRDGTNVFLYQLPEYLESREVPNYQEIDAIYRRVAAKYQIPFLNYNTELRSYVNYDKKYFWNWDHLNEEGSVLFSKIFAADIKNRLLGGISQIEATASQH